MTAALLLPYNRVTEIRLVVEAILKAPVSRLYIGADGPRDNASDRVACSRVHDYLDGVDWPFEVHKLYQRGNLGCSAAIKHHLDWFFEHEEHGVVLEDDCVPDPQFFAYCDVLLSRFATDDRVMCINGYTPFVPGGQRDHDYWFSIYPLSWGWGTWRRAWRRFRADMSGLDDFLAAERFPGAAGKQPVAARWADRFRLARSSPDYSWFVNWTYSCWAAGGLSVMPNASLVRNIGLTHGGKQLKTLPLPGADTPIGRLGWPLKHPAAVRPDMQRDAGFMQAFFHVEEPS
ncbi:MAG: hypothetical protein EON59_11580 [Alphaproteobacteria bacterium]|nr:MAG: hypothetical protein EON59_11580 [Alphaproteobacteria bacterium]